MRQHVFTDKVRSILSDNAGIRTVGRRRSGSGLDASRLALVPAGELRIFTRTERRAYHDYHFVIALDGSDSMFDGCTTAATACLVVHALDHALRNAGARVDVITYSNRAKLISAALVSDHKALLDELSQNPGGTQLERAITLGMDRLRQGGAPGRVFIEVTDGAPHDREECEDAYKLARRQGVTTLGVGLFHDGVMGYHGQRHAIVVKNLDTLYSDMARLIERHITRG